MRRLLHYTLATIGLLLILMTTLLHFRREGEGVPSLIAMEGGESRRLVQLVPFSGNTTPLTPALLGMEYLAYTPNGLLFKAPIGQGDNGLYRVPGMGAPPELLASQLWSRMVVAENGEWAVVMDSGGLDGNYGLRAVRTDGTEQYPLTLDLQEDLEINREDVPVISPDGAWVGFSVFARTGDFDVYRVRSDGTGLQNLTADITGTTTILGWSAVSESFIILHQNDIVMRVNAATGQLERMQPENVLAALWVTDIPAAGLDVLYIYPEPTALRAIDRYGNIAWEVPVVGPTSFAPDGSWGILSGGGRWQRIRGQDGKTFPLTLPRVIASTEVFWSPTLDQAIMRLDTQNGFTNRLLDLETGQLQSFLPHIPTWGVPFFRWSPDGQAVVVEQYGPYQFGFVRPDDEAIEWMTTSNDPFAPSFVDWGPPYQKTWSAGVLVLMGAGCVGGGMMMRFWRTSIVVRKAKHTL